MSYRLLDKGIGYNPSRVHRALYRVYGRVVRKVRSTEFIASLLFGFRPVLHGGLCSEYWDWTTVVLKRALQKYCSSDTSLLDLGTGPIGVLAIFCALKLRCKNVCACDHLAELLSIAETNARSCHVMVRFVRSDLFTDISERFDIIVFNPPYVDGDLGKKLGILSEALSEKRFSGGKDGCETIARFLSEAPLHLSEGGIAILGVNHYHVSRAQLNRLILHSDLVVKERIQSLFLQSSAYILQKIQLPGSQQK